MARVNQPYYFRLLFLSLVAAVCAFACAAPFAVAADKKPANKRELVQLETASRNGDIQACYILGQIYMLGKDVPKDLRKTEGYWFMGARMGNPKLQYALGLLKGGLLKNASSMFVEDTKASYAWLSLAERAGVKDADRALAIVAKRMDPFDLKIAKQTAEQYYMQYAYPYTVHFTIEINGQKITKDASIDPALPIMATFRHTNPAVTKIRMQHPRDPQLYADFPVDKPYELSNHEQHMKAGEISTSIFLALDDSGRIYDKITVNFVPPKNNETK